MSDSTCLLCHIGSVYIHNVCTIGKHCTGKVHVCVSCKHFVIFNHFMIHLNFYKLAYMDIKV